MKPKKYTDTTLKGTKKFLTSTDRQGICKHRDKNSNACKIKSDWCNSYEFCDEYESEEKAGEQMIEFLIYLFIILFPYPKGIREDEDGELW